MKKNSDIISCVKCGISFSSIEEYEVHAKNCSMTCKHYPNRSLESEHDLCSVGYIKAPNPFGGFWAMNFNGNKLYGVGFPEHIKRRGEFWRLHKTSEGWVWI